MASFVETPPTGPECRELARSFKDGIIRAAPNESAGAFVKTQARSSAHARAHALGREGALQIAHGEYEEAIETFGAALEHYRPTKAEGEGQRPAVLSPSVSQDTGIEHTRAPNRTAHI